MITRHILNGALVAPGDPMQSTIINGSPCVHTRCTIIGTKSATLSVDQSHMENSVFMGTYSGIGILSGLDMVAIGYMAGANGLEGIGNTYVGAETGKGQICNCLGNYNTALGMQALASIGTGSYNLVLGAQCAKGLNTANHCIIIGALSAPRADGAYNTIIGARACATLTYGALNTTVGYMCDTSSAESTCAVCIGAHSHADTYDVVIGACSGVINGHGTAPCIILGALSTPPRPLRATAFVGAISDHMMVRRGMGEVYHMDTPREYRHTSLIEVVDIINGLIVVRPWSAEAYMGLTLPPIDDLLAQVSGLAQGASFDLRVLFINDTEYNPLVQLVASAGYTLIGRSLINACCTLIFHASSMRDITIYVIT
jgi:hypothetical protein